MDLPTSIPPHTCTHTRAHTHKHTLADSYTQRHIYRYTRVRLRLRRFFRYPSFICGCFIISLVCVRTNKRRHKSKGIIHAPHSSPRFLHLPSYLDGDVELGGLLGGSGRFVNGSVQIHRHGEDRGVNWARLGQQAILQPRSDLVQPHQGVHWLVGVYGFTV